MSEVLSKWLRENVNDQIKVVFDPIKGGYASLIIFDGRLGVGKTTAAYQVGSYIEGRPLDMNRQYAMGHKEFKEKMALCEQAGDKVILYDEAGDFSSRAHAQAFNMELNRIFETYRTFNIIVLLIVPFFGHIDFKLFRNRIPRMLVHVYDRRRTTPEKRGKSFIKVYSYNKMMYMLEYTTKYRYRFFRVYDRQTPNTKGYIRDVTPEESAEIDRISTEGKRKIIGSINHTEEIEFNKEMLTDNAKNKSNQRSRRTDETNEADDTDY